MREFKMKNLVATVKAIEQWAPLHFGKHACTDDCPGGLLCDGTS
jgi:hypothetical protein